MEKVGRSDIEHPADEAVPAPVRVLVVDDHDLFRVGLASVLAARKGIEVVAQASRGSMAIRLAAELRPHVVLMDSRLPDLDGPSATRSILENDASVRIVMLTVTCEKSDIRAAVEAGVCGYMLKDSPIDDIFRAIQAAASGTAWLSPRAAETLLESIRGAPTRTASPVMAGDGLSEREIEVLRLLARGLDNNQIAGELSISPRTAKNHVANILKKLGLSNRVQAAVYAVRRGFA